MLSNLRRSRPTRLILFSVGLAGAIAFSCFAIRTPGIPKRTLRIGFEQVPPVQIRVSNGFSGLAVDTIREAARRARVSLQWVETGTSSEEALRRGLVDLWPIMADLPERRRHVHITRPWLHTSHTLMLSAGRQPPSKEFAGRIALVKLPIHARLVREEFPNAQLLQFGQAEEVLKAVCREAVFMGFLEDRAGLAALREKPVECAGTELRVYPLPHLTLGLGVGSTFAAAGAADRIRDEIGGMFRDGTLAVTIAKYSYYGLDATWATYALMEAESRARLVVWGSTGLGIALLITVWQAASLRQRKRSETALRESEERFRRVFEEGPLGVALIGKDHRFLKVNNALCQMVGYPEEALVQMTFGDITHADELRAFELDERLFRSEIPCYRMQKRYVKKNGESIWINLTRSLIRGNDGDPLYALAMVEDITEVKRTQEESLARQKLESVGTLASGIAHDFNNILGGVEAQAELALAELDEGSSCRDQLKAICEVANRGSEIVRQLMLYAGKENEAVEQVNLSKIVEEMLALLKVSVSKHARISADLDQGLPATRASAAQLRQVVMNLITNASDAIGDRDGVIHVITRRVITSAESVAVSESLPEGDYMALEVSDTGCGMSPETQARVFDPFFTTKSAGRGLGLAVVLGIVRGLGGAMRLTSEPGKGSKFQILLPCAETSGAATGETPCAEELADPVRFAVVLVVEDEDPLREAVVKMLRKAGFDVLEAASGAAALDALRANRGKIDVILLDATIPGPSSDEVVAEAMKASPDVRVILTSAYSPEMLKPIMSRPQIRGFIRKPFQFSNLIQTLRKAIAT